MVIETRINTGSDQNVGSNQDGEDKADVRSIKAGESRGPGNLLGTWGRQESVAGPQDTGFMGWHILTTENTGGSTDPGVGRGCDPERAECGVCAARRPVESVHQSGGQQGVWAEGVYLEGIDQSSVGSHGSDVTSQGERVTLRGEDKIWRTPA